MAVLNSKQGQSFDPEQIAVAINNAGFSAPQVEVTAAGTLEKDGKGLALRVPHLRYVLHLEGGKQFARLSADKEMLGKVVTITGKVLHPSPHPKPPYEMSVESFAKGTERPPEKP